MRGKVYNKAICTGLSPLLNLCASDVLEKTVPIYYLWYHGKNGVDSRALSEASFARAIADHFSYKLEIIGPHYVDYSHPTLRLRKKNHINITADTPNIDVSDGDIITFNAVVFLKKFLRGQRILIFPEGASCFSQFLKSSVIRKFLGKLKRRIVGGHFKVIREWVLPDADGHVKSLISKSQRHDTFDAQKFQKKRLEFGAHHLPEKLRFDCSLAVYFHPLIKELDESGYIEWEKEIQKIVGNSLVLLKKHPSDTRDYNYVFQNLNFILVPDEHSQLPAEIFINPETMTYIGYHSSSMLCFPKDRRIIIPPSDTSSIDFYEEEYSGLINILF